MEQKKTTGLGTSLFKQGELSVSDIESLINAGQQVSLRPDGKVEVKARSMTLGEYADLAMRTAKDMGSPRENLIHAALGITSDAGEVATLIKGYAVYGKDLNREHLLEELGDTFWFIVLATRSAGFTLEEVARYNVEKLSKRYPDKYSDAAAIARADKA